MLLQINGKDREVGNAATVEELIVQLGIHRRIVVELNGRILEPEEYAQARLAEGDRLEIAHFVGGGT
jgi:thiamine biosynthesis protein ThiS